MDDTLDVLKISKDGESVPSKKKRCPRPKRPEGISREAYSLLDDSHPVVQITLPLKKRTARKDVPSKKRKGDVSYTVSYKWKPFRNEARTDGLELKKWVRCFIDKHGNHREANATEYPFAKLNKQPDVIVFSDHEWKRCLSTLSLDWTRQETEYLLSLCRQFSLRFPLIEDRYNYNGRDRSYEEIKERYYSMAHALACFRSGEELPSKYLQKHPYDAAYERRRRAACRKVMEMTWEEEWRDNAILDEADRIEAQRLENAVIAASHSSDDAASDVSLSQVLNGHDDSEAMPMHDSTGEPMRPSPGIYVRGQESHKSVTVPTRPSEQKVLVDFSVEACYPTVCTRRLMKAWIDLHNDAMALARLREIIDDDSTEKATDTPM